MTIAPGQVPMHTRWTWQAIAGQQIADTESVIPFRENHRPAAFTLADSEELIAAHVFMDDKVVA